MTLISDSGTHEMSEEIRGSGIFRLENLSTLTGTTKGCLDTSCTVTATNAQGATVTGQVISLEYADLQAEPVKPKITGVSVNRAENYQVDPSVFINVSIDVSADWPVSRVWLYDPKNSTVPIELAEDIDYWSGSQDRWFIKTTLIKYENLSGATIVAEIDKTTCPPTNPNCYDTLIVQPGDMAAVASGSGQLDSRTELGLFGLTKLTYSYIDFKKTDATLELTGTKGTAATPWRFADIISNDDAIVAFPDAEVFLTGYGLCPEAAAPIPNSQFLINAEWADLNHGVVKTGTKEERKAYYDSFTSTWITTNWPNWLNRTGAFTDGYTMIPKDQGGCEDFLPGQYRILLIDIGEGYLVKFMFYDYNLGNRGWNAVRYMFEVYRN